MEQATQGQPYQAFMRTDLSYLPEHKREDPGWLAEQVEALKTVTEAACRARMAGFRTR